MCGIVGIIGTNNEAVTRKMLNSIHHRGPDDEGMYADPSERIMLGHRRLSIIDLTAAGHQPMSYENERYWICYNGEVYNYLEIKSELIALGKKFTTNSDTEVILAAYSMWGDEAVNRLRGMFAFAIWDTQEKRLFIARDRIGIKPLYYSQYSKYIIFASELKSIVASGIIPISIDPSAIYDYLQYSSISQPRTIYTDIHALLPGHYLVAQDGKIKITQYWDLSTQTDMFKKELEHIDYHEAIRLVKESLEDATRHHLIADVPVGAFLSGGIDSTAVVALMSKITKHRIKTYSVGFSKYGKHYNELPWAKKVAEYFNTDHTEIVVSPHEAAEYFQSMMKVIDQPSADGLNTYIVSLFARQGVTVSLSGLGGDEIFGGYPHFHRIIEAKKYLPQGNSAMNEILKHSSGFIPYNIQAYLQTLASSPEDRILGLRRLSDFSMINLFSESFMSQIHGGRNASDRFNNYWRDDADAFDAISYFECSTYLRNTLLRDADQTSMAHSLEVRPVLLDHKLVELVYSLPTRHKYRIGAPKHIFVEAIKDIIPQFVIARKKMGFELPLIDWLNSDLNDHARRVFETSWAKNIFSQSYINEVVVKLKKKEVKDFRIWAYFVLLLFLENNSMDS